MKIFTLLALTLLGFSFLVTAGDWQNFYLHSPKQSLALQDTLEENEEYEVEYVSLKSPAKAGLFSAVIPGSGQWYAGAYLKAAGFVAIEATSWYLYLHYTERGKDLEEKFENYADTHWNEDKYWDWIAHHSGLPRNDLAGLRAWEQAHFSHGLHEQKDQQYYEMIGKYDQFNYGWDDVDASLIGEEIPYWRDHRSPTRLQYEGMRKDSNDAFKNATTSITITIINHLLSALDATWTVTRHNRELAEASLFLQPKWQDRRPYTALTLQIKW